MKAKTKKISITSLPLHIQMEQQLNEKEGHNMQKEEAEKVESADYVPFGPDWEKEVMRLRKKDLIKMLRGALIEKRELGVLVGEAAGIIAFNRMKQEAGQAPVDVMKAAAFGSVSEEYLAGYDAGKNGPNRQNSNHLFFSTKQKATQWQMGYKAGAQQAPGPEENNSRVGGS